VFAGPGWPTDWTTKAPPPGQFPFQADVDGTMFNTLTTQFKVGEGVLANVCNAPLASGGQLAIAIHTDSQGTAGGGGQTGWAQGDTAFGGARWGWYSSLCVPCKASATSKATFSSDVLKMAAGVPDPNPTSTMMKVAGYQNKKDQVKGMKGTAVVKAKLDDVASKTPGAVDATVSAVQKKFDDDKEFAKKGVKVTVTKGKNGDDIDVKLEKSDGTDVDEETKDAAAKIVASLAVVEEVIPAVEPVNAVDVKATKAAANIAALATSAVFVAIIMA